MNAEKEQEIVIINRINLYKLLSILYSQPTVELANDLQLLKDTMEIIDPGLVSLVNEMELEFNIYKEDLTKLKVDHARLFIGPFDILAPPYSSIYFDGESKVMSESTLIAMEYYKNAGLDMNGNFKDAPDHVIVELEFMYYLIFKYLNTNDNRFIKYQLSFLKNHLYLWIAPFTERIQKSANTIFYKNLAIITIKFIGQELQQVLSLQSR